MGKDLYSFGQKFVLVWATPLFFKNFKNLLNSHYGNISDPYGQICPITVKTHFIESVTAIQRKPVDPSKEWSYLLSQQIEDWYSTEDSKLFTKTEYTFTAKVFIEATELGDIMMNVDGLTIFQGTETPNENSTTTVDQCGQV